ncbi:MAG: winged helix-turn-helix transcriptional regulator [Chloroflexi bacterium]|nr:winged helix-turn-helix transcriptional regulator [Chloroflexota bacterium]
MTEREDPRELANRPEAIDRAGTALRRSNEAVARAASVLCEPTRLRILAALATGELTVTELTTVLNRPQPAVSQHLRVLRDRGLVESTAYGRFRVYQLRDREIEPVIADVIRYFGDISQYSSNGREE